MTRSAWLPFIMTGAAAVVALVTYKVASWWARRRWQRTWDQTNREDARQ